jgi:hypothetical protein
MRAQYKYIIDRLVSTVGTYSNKNCINRGTLGDPEKKVSRPC